MTAHYIYLEFDVTGEKITRTDNVRIASGTKIIKCRFKFSGDWNGVLAPKAVFKKGSVYLEMPVTAGECPVPCELTSTPGIFSVSVYGGDLRTTEIHNSVAVVPSGFAYSLPPECLSPARDYVRSTNVMISDIRLNPMTGVFEISCDNGAMWTEFPAYNGWTPEIAVVTDGKRCVLQVTGWKGGEGYKPPSGVYIGAGGFTANVAQAVDIRGERGLKGAKGDRGDKGDKGDRGAGANIREFDSYDDYTQWLVSNEYTPGVWGIFPIEAESDEIWRPVISDTEDEITISWIKSNDLTAPPTVTIPKS